MNSAAHYDVAIIGAGLAGLAAGIRLAHFGKKVCIFERHNVPGGLNSFYSVDGRRYDTGLHAVTNYVERGVKGTALGKLLRQLRIERDELQLCPQRESRVSFFPKGDVTLRFNNDYALFEGEVARAFPAQIDGFRRLSDQVKAISYVTEPSFESARAVVRSHISDPLLEDMIFCPLMFYGSARENDMDFGQFALMYRAIFFEGFSRPAEGIRLVIRLLLDKYRSAGGERRMKCGIKRILSTGGRATALVLDSGEEVTAGQVLSSVGAVETAALIAPEEVETGAAAPAEGRLTFVETMSVFNRQPEDFGWGTDTIVFFNDSERFHYEAPKEQVDPRSGVACIPNNFQFAPGPGLPEGMFRVTCLARYDAWANLPEDAYQKDKARWFDVVQTAARRYFPKVSDSDFAAMTVATDMFTPRTIERFTGHRNGAIYGSPKKNPRGLTALDNVHLCGTDQGLLGIVGSMLSGIMMANDHILSKT